MTISTLGERDILRFRMISDPQLSPDGSQVAFVLTEQDQKANRQATSIWLVAADGSSEPRRLTLGPRDSKPRWSPDGGRLAFLGAREREWAKDLYLLEMAGGEPRRLAQLPRGIAEYAWSAEGDRLCLTGGSEFPPDLDREPPANSEEARQRYQERVRVIRRFRYRLDGQGVLDDEARQLWIVDARGGSDPRMITDGETDVVRPRWVSGGRIAFLGNREPDHDESNVVEVYAVAASGGAVERMTRYGKAMTGFEYSTDGMLATLRTDTDNPFGREHVRLWIDDRCVTRELDRTSAAVVLSDTSPGREATDPVWDDGRVFFEVSDRGSVHLYRAGPEEGPGCVVGGRRVVTGFSVAGGRLAFVSTSFEDPISLRVAALDGSGERVLFEPNSWMKEISLGGVRPFNFHHEGREIDGWALLPPGAAEGARVPTLLYIHGGPHAAYGWSFPFVFQILAGVGNAVVFCNPPGSQSYAEEFAKSLTGAWGEMDFPYFMALVDRAVEDGFADPERLGVGGASYGGFSTLWVITHTDRFKAAVSARPVSSMHGFYGSADVGWNFGAASMGAEPWEDPELYERLSPVTYLDRVTTPLRLIAGTGDMRTPAEQAEQVFVRLRKMGKEVDLVVLHGEPHAVVVQGKPWHRVRHMRAVLEWFGQHLRVREPAAV